MIKILHYRRLVLGLLASAILFQPAFAAKNLNTYLQMSVNHDDIIEGNENYLQLSLSSKWTKGINRNSNFSVRGKVATQQYQELSNANRDEIELQLTYNYQASSGYFAPKYSIQFKTINEQGDLSFDTDKLSLAFIRRQPLTNSIEFSLGFKTQKHTGTEKRDINSVFLNTDYILNYQTILYAGLNIADEDIDTSTTSSSSLNTDELGAKSVDISGHHSVTTPTSSSSGSDKIQSDNTSISMGMIYQVDQQHTFDILYMRNNYKTDSTLKNNIISIDYFYKF